MCIRSILQASFLFLVSSSCMAQSTIGCFEGIPIIWGKVITLNAGPAWAAAGSTQKLRFLPSGYDTFKAKKSHNTLASGEIVFSLQRQLNNYMMGQIGLAAAGAGEADAHGKILIDGDPAQAFYRYKYKVNHARLTIKGKLLGGNNTWKVNPYLSGSFGVSFNHSYHYNVQSIAPLLPRQPKFRTQTQSVDFAFTLGAGAQLSLNPHWQLGAGYEFADWGKSSLGRDYSNFYIDKLHLSNLITHQFLLSLSYLY